MPKSKRAKVVHLTQVDKKGKELTLKLFANVQESIDKYKYIFVFSVDNMRNTYLKKVRADLSDSRLFFGKTKVMAKALGSTPETAYQTNTHLLAPYLAGNVGLLFTDRSPEDVSAHFAANTPTDFARAGTRATRRFAIPKGIVYSLGGEVAAESDVPMAHGLEPELRRLNVPTSLSKGKITLQNEYEVCREGQVLDSRQTRLLKLFGVATAEFRVRVVAYWSAESGTVEEVDGEAPEEMEE
ncbi:mRNA turnover and ribosome assembly protein [Pseudogymnoascus verrucosus]|uniref:Ribosome assembly factor mrt4 n=1 Tax=Pseudogymnoascus verrucosus TaxID=342668 RepID=A0A1B8GSE7_9PEZI|nr:mRNA turnover and ribosome assembly protein [Pseudogymnoascus verrucosus]OBT98759.1 mRNA turnover and ribosome assembly protein [Pseudogymnoascus verrucosus]